MKKKRHLARRSYIVGAAVLTALVAVVGAVSVWQHSHVQTSVLQPNAQLSLWGIAHFGANQPTSVPNTERVMHNGSLPKVVNATAPVVYRVDTKEKVVFLGIDDGAYKDKEVVDLLKQNNIKASLYLSDAFIHSDPAFFKQVLANGSVIEDHSVSHDINMSKKPFAYQKKEICDMADLDEKYYGHRPIFFRPPGGAYTATTQQAAAACGMKAVVTWIAKANGGSMQYQVGHELHAGDVVLMHFRPEFKQDLQAFIKAEAAAGLHTELLEDWV